MESCHCRGVGLKGLVLWTYQHEEWAWRNCQPNYLHPDGGSGSVAISLHPPVQCCCRRRISVCSPFSVLACSRWRKSRFFCALCSWFSRFVAAMLTSRWPAGDTKLWSLFPARQAGLWYKSLDVWGAGEGWGSSTCHMPGLCENPLR